MQRPEWVWEQVRGWARALASERGWVRVRGRVQQERERVLAWAWLLARARGLALRRDELRVWAQPLPCDQRRVLGQEQARRRDVPWPLVPVRRLLGARVQEEARR